LKKAKTETKPVEGEPVQKKKPNWKKLSIILNIVLFAAIGLTAATVAILHQSDTNPKFCATCHLMDSHVESYLNGNNLDAVHAAAGVECKQCHSDYKLPQEVGSAFKFVIGNYDPSLPRRKYGDEMCLQCHISMDYQAEKTSFLTRNPHKSHYSDIRCRACHISHGDQIDYCAQCHDNGGQRMIGTDIVVPK
jgi:hypothetical protein